MTYSEDLRKRVVDFVKNGGKKKQAARLFCVSLWCVRDWVNRPSLAPQKAGPKSPWKLKPTRLTKEIEATPDAYLDELAETLGVSRSTVGYGLKRLRLTRKKNDTLQSTKRREKTRIPAGLKGH
jgi:putative transposase